MNLFFQPISIEKLCLNHSFTLSLSLYFTLLIQCLVWSLMIRMFPPFHKQAVTTPSIQPFFSVGFLSHFLNFYLVSFFCSSPSVTPFPPIPTLLAFLHWLGSLAEPSYGANLLEEIPVDLRRVSSSSKEREGLLGRGIKTVGAEKPRCGEWRQKEIWKEEEEREEKIEKWVTWEKKEKGQ
jgi:hypothetical protein